MSLQALAAQDFEGSALSFESLARSNYVSLMSADQLKKALPQVDPKVIGGVEFRYHDFDRQPTGYSRYKCYYPPLSGFAAAAKDGRPKYLQAPDTPVEVYLPPVVDWKDVLGDKGHTLVITEGEKKTLALAERGVPCAGLGGVDSIGNAKRGSLLLGSLKKLCEGRNVLIVFDVDEGHTALKPAVARAAQKLAYAVMNCGGTPEIVTLPSDGSKKCALDDWLQRPDVPTNPIALVMALKGFSLPLDSAKELYDEASRYVFIKDICALGEIATRELMTVSNYRVYAGNAQIPVQTTVLRKPDAKGGPPTVGLALVVKTLAEAFLTWPARPTLSGVSYVPGLESHVTADGRFNQWKGWAQPVPERVEPSDLDPLWRAFQDLYGVDAEYMWNWFMYPIARPGAKMVTVVVIQSEKEGIGKSSIPAFFAKYVYGEGKGTPNNATTLNSMSLDDDRLEYMVNKQFLFLDDANDLHGNKVEALIKNLATAPTVRANPKYIQSFECENLANLGITTNRTLPFRLGPEDRRLFYPYVSPDVPARTWEELKKWFQNGGGGKVVAYAQQHFNVDAVDPYANAPMTHKKRLMVSLAMTPFECFVAGLRQEAEEGKLARVVFTGKELKAMAEYEGVIKSTHEVQAAGMHKSMLSVGAVRCEPSNIAGHRVRTEPSATPETFYALADFTKWVRASSVDLIEEYKRVPHDRIRIVGRKPTEKVVPIKKGVKK